VGCLAVVPALVSARRWQLETDARLGDHATIVDTAVGPIEVAETGTGDGGTVLVLHGSPGGFDQGLVLARLIGDESIRFIAPSRPGALGTPLAIGVTPAEQAEAMVAVLDALGVEEPVGLVGMSAGGMAALEIAANRPDRVRTLVLWESVTVPYRWPVAGSGPTGRWSMTSWVLAGALPTLARLSLPRSSSAEAVREAVDVLRSALPLDRRTDLIRNDALQGRKVDAALIERVVAPVLLVHGSSDRSVPLRHSVESAARARDARLLTIEGGNHVSTLVDREARDAIRVALQR